MKFSFDEGSDNHNLREMIYGADFSGRIEKFADSFRKAEKKIRDKYDKLDRQLQTKEAKEMNDLVKDWQKKLKVSIETPTE